MMVGYGLRLASSHLPMSSSTSQRLGIVCNRNAISSVRRVPHVVASMRRRSQRYLVSFRPSVRPLRRAPLYFSTIVQCARQVRTMLRPEIQGSEPCDVWELWLEQQYLDYTCLAERCHDHSLQGKYLFPIYCTSSSTAHQIRTF